jgi:hypothetical protein
MNNSEIEDKRNAGKIIPVTEITHHVSRALNQHADNNCKP